MNSICKKTLWIIFTVVLVLALLPCAALAEGGDGYTVTYMANSATGGTAPVDELTYQNGDSAAVLDNTGGLVREGYNFAGWNTAADGTGDHFAPSGSISITDQNVILYAQWSVIDYFITYNANEATGGSVPEDPAAYHIGEPVATAANTGSLVKTGYTFTGWNTASNGSGTHYAPTDTFTMPASNVTLYAEWKYNYFVTYNRNNGTGTAPTDSAPHYVGSTVTVFGNTGGLTRNGYTFTGWNTASNGTGTHYAPADTFTMPASNVTLYAEWKRNYNVMYYGYGETGTVPIDPAAYIAGSTVTVLGNTGNLTQAGYTFAGWNTYSNGAGTHYAPGDTFTMPEGTVYLYAQWSQNYNSHDTAKIQAFLTQNSYISGKTNAQLKGFSLTDPSTWSGVSWVLSGNEWYIKSVFWVENSLSGNLDLSGCAQLQTIDCYENYLTGLNVSGCSLLTEISCYGNAITGLSVSGCSSLTEISCYGNAISSLALNGLTKLTTVDCSYNSLTSINVSGDMALKYFDCYSNNLTSLNISGLSALEGLDCGRNKIKSLALKGLSVLSELYCDENPLSSLDVSVCPALEALRCSYCSLTSINVSGCNRLIVIDCSHNSLTSLSIAPTLTYIDCRSNLLGKVSVNLPGQDTPSVPLTLKASGPGYVGLYFNKYGGRKVYATAITPATFTKWALPDGTASTSAEFTITRGGTYTANFVYSQGPYLSGVKLSAGALSPAFSKTKYSYKINLSENTGSFTLTPTKLFSGLGMTINGKSVSSYTVSLANGKSATITVKVSYGSSSKTYKFTVTRAKSTNNNLATLTASTGKFNRAFDPAVTSYTLTLDQYTKSVKISDTVASSLASVSPKSKMVSLSNGQTTKVTITVKAQSGAKKTYTITVTRAPSTDTGLKYLKTNSGSYALTPSFSAGVTNYTVTLPASQSSVTISAKTTGYKATLYFDGAKKTSKKVTLASGQSVTVRVTVVAQAGNKKEYVITVRRP